MMDGILTLLGAGILEALQPLNLIMIIIGCTVGLLVGRYLLWGHVWRGDKFDNAWDTRGVNSCCHGI